jgi:hypothetical protein
MLSGRDTPGWWALAIARGGLGRIDGVEETLRRIDARVESFEIGVHQAAVVAAMWVRALLLGGLVDRAGCTSRRYRERCQNVPGPGDVMTSLMCAEVAKARGQIRTATRWLRQGIAGLRSADPGGWSFVALVALTGALGMTGDATSARQALMEMTAARHPTFAFVEPDALLARAWLAAAEGGVSEAVALGRHAAEVAASRHQPAVELLALHTAVCFGDRTVADRLAQLATQVDGPRAPAAATDQPGTRDRHAGSRRPVQPPNRRPARRVGPHRRGPPLPGLRETRCLRPR